MNTLVLYFSNIVFHLLPETRCFAFKRFLLRLCGAKVGKNVRICSSVKILGNHELTIGDDSWIGHDTIIICSAKVAIGENVYIAPRCYIGTGTHEITPDGDSIAGKGYSLPIVIGDGAWICACSTLLAGSVVGAMAIIAAGSVVNGSINSYELAGGIPAKHIKPLRTK